MAAASVWASGLTKAATAGFGFATGNPLVAVGGAISFAGWLAERWEAASQETTAAERPTMTLSEAVNSISPPEDPPASFVTAAAKARPTRAGDERAVQRRAEQIASSDQAGTDFDNWMRAVIELKVAQRAEEISRSPEAGTDEENWMRAERELRIAARAEEIARSPASGSDCDNWLRAEHEVAVAQRAEEIARSPDRGSDLHNWTLAERELEAEHHAITARAEEIAGSAEQAIATRLWVEVMIRAEEISESPEGRNDLDNWVRAERELQAKQTRISERVLVVAASPEAALANWLAAERELRARGRIGSHATSNVTW